MLMIGTINDISNVVYAETPTEPTVAEMTTFDIPVVNDPIEVAGLLASGGYELTPLEKFAPEFRVVNLNGSQFVMHAKAVPVTPVAATPVVQVAAVPQPTTGPKFAPNGFTAPAVAVETPVAGRPAKTGRRSGPPCAPATVRERHALNPYWANIKPGTWSYKAFLFDEIAARPDGMDANDCADWFIESGWVRVGADNVAETRGRLVGRCQLKLGEMIKTNVIALSGNKYKLIAAVTTELIEAVTTEPVVETNNVPVILNTIDDIGNIDDIVEVEA